MSKRATPTEEAKELAIDLAVARQFERQQPRKGRIEAFELLAARLDSDARLYEVGDIQDQRDAVADCLLAIHDYLDDRGISPRTQRPLMRAVSALVERENNNLDALFCEPKGAHRPKSPLGKLQQDGAIAAFANHWLKYHRDTTRTQREQFGEIARRLDGNNLGKMDAARIKQARELVSQEPADHPARKMHDVVDFWLTKASNDFSPSEALGIILPMTAQFSNLWKI